MEIRTPAAELQYQIFRAIAQKCGEKKAVIAIAEALNLGQSAVYNRLNGRQVLHLEEAVTLARHFDLHLDPWIIGNGQKAIFDLRTLRAPVTSCRDFLTPIAQQLALLASLPDLVLWYSTNEVPFFHYMNFRELSLFKLFAWARINWQLPAFQHFKFDPAHFPEPEVFESLMQPMLQDYTAIRGIEFWNLNIFDNTLSQIQYFHAAGQIAENSTTELLLRQVELLRRHQYAMAKSGQKFVAGQKTGAGASFDLYFNEVAPTNITFLIESNEIRAVYTVFDNPNFMLSTDSNLYNYTLGWMEKMRIKCLHISNDAERNRERFFELLRKRIGERIS